MANATKRAEQQIREITECSICMNAFTDPRMLPCIHTFCFQCIKHTGEAAQKKSGDNMPCPLCRKEFTIPQEGIIGLQKNFFMENLLEFQTTLQSNDPNITIGSETEEEIKRMNTVKYCTKHTEKVLDNYCVDCKELVCVKCSDESHRLHDCKDVATVEEGFRQMIEKRGWKTSNYADEMLSLKQNTEIRKADFLIKVIESETAIIRRNQELKNAIDKHTNSLLDELSVIKSRHLKKIENKMEEIDTYCTILRSFDTYCIELVSKGSASDICSSVDEIMARADYLERDLEEFIGRPYQSIAVSFQTTNLAEILQMANNNFVGQIKAETETTAQFENWAVVVGLNDGPTLLNDIIKINLHRPKQISTLERIPTRLAPEAVAVVSCNTMYVTGIGAKRDEIRKYNKASGWKKCASLVQGRRRHSAAFIDEVLYVCGGFVDSTESILDSVEAFNAVTNKCATVGKLVHRVRSSGNCVPYKSSLHIFGGSDKDGKNVNHVQVYNTTENICTLLSAKMPRSSRLMGAVLWETTAILLGRYTCFIFNFEAETWQERKLFKTDLLHFGLVLENERIFVIGGGDSEKNKDGKTTWTYRDDVRYIPLRNIIEDKPIEWKIHGKLPKPSLGQACANMRFSV